MRKAPRTRARTFFAPWVAAMLVGLSLVVMGGSTAEAGEGQATCNEAPYNYTKYDTASGTNQPIMDGAVQIGTMSWADGSITYAIDPGYTVEFCVKQANNDPWESGPRTGSGTAVSPWDDMSHVGYKVVQTPPECPDGDLNGEEPGCAEDQPPALVREVAGVQASCRLQGTLTWVDVYTTEFVWNEETQTWEPGTETGPVRTNEEFVKYTDQQFQNQCAEEPEVAGEQGNDIKHELPEVKGEQAAVPGAVNAGLGTTPTPMGAERNPLWLLAVAGGLGLIGVAGRRRRPTAAR